MKYASVSRSIAVYTAMLLLTGCSGNMTGGATTPVSPQQPASAAQAPGGPQTQSVAGQALGVGSPQPAQSAEVVLGGSPTPIALPTTSGFGGSVLLRVPSPAPSESPALVLTVRPLPSDAPMREGHVYFDVTHPLVAVNLYAEVGDSDLPGTAALTFTVPTANVQAAHHMALGFFDTAPVGQKHALFHHGKKSQNTTLLELEPSITASATGIVHGTSTGLIRLHEKHTYVAVLYVDHTPTPLVVTPPTALPSPNASSLAGHPGGPPPTVSGTPGGPVSSASTLPSGNPNAVSTSAATAATATAPPSAFGSPSAAASASH